MSSIRVRYISDKHSIFFTKGEIYDAYRLDDYPNSGLIAFHFTEEEMDEDGMYALPAERFEVVSPTMMV